MPNTLDVLPDDLIAFAWSAPMRDLAAKVGLSDVGLRKILRGFDVPLPPQGHWNRMHAGRLLPDPPKAQERRPGENGRVQLDARFKGILVDRGGFPVDGPFASRFVPENLDELRAQVRSKISRVAVPRLGSNVHPEVAAILKRDEQRTLRRNEWSQPEGKLFGTPYWLRQLRLLNALFFGVMPHGGRGSLNDRDGALNGSVRIGDSWVSLTLRPAKRVATEVRGGIARVADTAPARTPITLTVDEGHKRAAFASFSDDATGTLEQKLPDIVAKLVTAGEAAFRRGLREQQQWLDQCARWEAERLEAARAAREAARAKRLNELAASLREAEDIRALVGRVTDRVAETDSASVAAWAKWALARADALDPVMSGALFAEFSLAPGAS